MKSFRQILGILTILCLCGCGGESGNKNKQVFTAIEKGDISTVRKALSQGLDINTKNEFGTSLLSLAVMYNQTEVVALLIEKGAEFDSPSKSSGYTPLFVAAREGNVEMVSYFLKKGADIRRLTSSGNNVLMSTIQSTGCSSDMVKYLLDKGVDINHRCGRGMTALHWAVDARKNEAIKLLIAKGADVDIRDNRGANPLMLALCDKKSNPEILSLLIEKTKKLNVKSKIGMTALDIAKANFPNSTIVKELIDAGAKTSAELNSEAGKVDQESKPNSQTDDGSLRR